MSRLRRDTQLCNALGDWAELSGMIKDPHLNVVFAIFSRCLVPADDILDQGSFDPDIFRKVILAFFFRQDTHGHRMNANGERKVGQYPSYLVQCHHGVWHDLVQFLSPIEPIPTGVRSTLTSLYLRKRSLSI